MRQYFVLFYLIASTNVLANPTSAELWQNVRLVHLTNYLADHTVKPGAAGLMDSSELIEKIIADERLASRSPYRFIPMPNGKVLALDIANWNVQTRITSHWSVFEPVRNAAIGTQLDERTRADWNNATIAVIEFASNVRGNLIGGYHMDMMLLGPHTLSEDSAIIAPQALEAEIRAKNPGYPGQFWFYDANRMNVREAVHQWNQMFKAADPNSWDMRWTKPASELEPADFSFLFFLAASTDTKESDSLRLQVNAIREMGRVFPKDVPAWFFDRRAAMIGATRDLREQVRTFVNLFEQEALYGHLYLNGRLRLAKDVFSAWREDERLYWGSHNNTAFHRLEVKLKEVFADTMKERFVASLYSTFGATPDGAKKCSISIEDFAKSSLEISAILTEIDEQYASRLSGATHQWFINYVQDIGARLGELGSRCGFSR